MMNQTTDLLTALRPIVAQITALQAGGGAYRVRPAFILLAMGQAARGQGPLSITTPDHLVMRQCMTSVEIALDADKVRWEIHRGRTIEGTIPVALAKDIYPPATPTHTSPDWIRLGESGRNWIARGDLPAAE